MTGLALGRGVRLPAVRFGDVAALLIGVFFLAGAIHIATILLVPNLAQGDGWSRLAPLAGDDRFAQVAFASETGEGVGGLDPLFVTAVCRLRLQEEPAGIVVDARDRFWSLALYDPKGTIIFSLNDRTAVGGRLDMIVVNAAQNAELKKAPTGETDLTIVVESGVDDLIALLRLFAPTESTREDARAVLEQAECLPAPSILPGVPSG
jgi:uncharacterized membrane protein